MDSFVTKVKQSLITHRLIAAGDVVLVAVSGGVDSMVLLDALRQLAGALGFQVRVAHYNHQLRGRASDLDEQLVKAYCAKHGLKLETGRGDVRKLAREKKISIEMAARELRQAFLAETATKLKCQRVALAHHADDQLELFFIRLFRGSGGEGLGGMDWKSPLVKGSKIRRIRPLLDVRKQEILAYAMRERVLYREDATNRDTDILRNRIRNKLLPQVAKTFGEAVLPPMLRTMEVVGDEAAFAEQEAVLWLAKLLAGKRRKAFDKLHLAVQRRVLLRQLRHYDVPETFELIESLRRQRDIWIQADARTFLRRKPEGSLERREPLDTAFQGGEVMLDLTWHGQGLEFGGLTLAWSCIASPKRFRKPKPVAKTEVFDAEKVGCIIRLRFWRPGDRFQPLGMPQPVKLQDWFVNRKIPLQKRRKLAVAETADGRIFWVEGERIGEQFKLDKDSRQRLKWQWRATNTP